MGSNGFSPNASAQGVDYFNPDLAQHFLELTHEKYRAGLKPEAWQHVEVIFCDEPEFGLGHAYDSLSKHGAIPWTPKLPGLFRARHGEDLLPHMPQIFFSAPGAAEVRMKFWELLTDVFNESFTAPVNDWCSRHGKRFTAHVKGEEHPLFQVPTNGSDVTSFSAMFPCRPSMHWSVIRPIISFRDRFHPPPASLVMGVAWLKHLAVQDGARRRRT